MRAAFVAANLLIALDYVLIGFYFLARTSLFKASKRPTRKALVACLAAGLFFFGCVHTHLDLILMDLHDAHWYSWWNLTSHVMQGVGGFTFWFLARHHLTLHIFDRQAYEQATDAQAEERLQRIAMELGLIRR